MKKLFLAATIALSCFAGTAGAQDLNFRVFPDGLQLRNDERPRVDDRRYDRQYDRPRVENERYERPYDRPRYRGQRAYGRDCRVVTTRFRRPNGVVVVQRERRCF